jgi:hypothetical protein
MNAKKRHVAIAGLLAVAATAFGAEVWTTTFSVDGDQDGLVNLYDGDLDKDLFAGPVGGFLTVETHDDTPAGYPYTPDKGGRPLGAVKTADDAFSALYRFQWDVMWGDKVLQDGSQAYEVAGFLGSGAPQTRQVVGALMVHWQIADGSYYINLGAIVGGSGDQVIDQSGGSTWLGPDAQGKPYLLAIGWDGTTKTIKVQLFDGLLGTSVASLTRTVTSPPPLVLDFAMTHLGWSDYTGNMSGGRNVWGVSSLSYYDTFNGAFDAVTPFTGKVWEATFATDRDGFVDVFNGPDKEMLTGPVNGRLGVHQIDDDILGSPYVPDKSGRPIGVALDETYSWSALYKYRWTNLPAQETPQVFEFTGAFGNAVPQTREMVGALITHWKVGADYYINLGLLMGGSGDQQLDQSGGSVYLGPDAPTTDYQLAIGWDTATDTLTAELFLADGTSVASHSMHVTVPTPVVTDYQITHLGWSDYTGEVNLAELIDSEVSSVAFYLNDPQAAFNDVGPKTVQADFDKDGDVDLADFGVFQGCFNGPNRPYAQPTGCQPCDLDGDNDVDLADFGVFQACFNGPNRPPNCAP